MTDYALQTESALQTDSLTKIYGSARNPTRAVDGLALKVPEGAIYGLLGRNSAGKTTTIRMAMGLSRPDSGSIRVLGLDPTVESQRVRMLAQTGYVPEDKMFLTASARHLLNYNRGFYRSTWSDELARSLCERLELPLDTPFLKLSLGNKTKCALVTAIAQRSRLLILDEPTTGLDPVVMDRLLRILVEECTADGRTIFLSSHQLNEIQRIAEYIGIMDRGRLLYQGRLDDLLARFRRVSIAGEALPMRAAAILSAERQGRGVQYVLRDEPNEFIAQLVSNGAQLVDDAPLTLQEIFIELCRGSEAAEIESEVTA